MRFFKTLACCALVVFSSAGCKISDDVNTLLDLPEATQTGMHTFGCKVDGKNWRPYAEHTLDRSIEDEYYGTAFNVRLENEIGNIPFIYLALGDSSGIQEKTYVLGKDFNATVTMKTDSLQDEVFDTRTGDDLEGYVTITKVKQPGAKITDKGILAGTFSFTARSATTQRITKVTDGRFDFALY
jgi:hypothetical protein